MNKSELIKVVAQRMNEKPTHIQEVLNAILQVIAENISEGVEIRNFGTFEVIKTAERMGHNPQTGEVIKIPAGKRIKFTAGVGLKP